MIKSLYLFTVLVLTLVMAACQSQTATTQPAADLEASALPQTVDVATTAALQGQEDVLLIDVREDWEYQEGHIPGITHIPMAEIPDRLSEIPTDKTVIMTCRSGNRSGQVTELLRQNGYDNVHNMEGGLQAWEQAGYPVER